MNHPPLPAISRLGPSVIRILGHNPGKYTLQGTNTYLIGTGRRRILIDTGAGLVQWRENLQKVLNGTCSELGLGDGEREGEGEGEGRVRSSGYDDDDDDEKKIEIQDVILTHRHADHVGGVDDVLELCGGRTRVWRYIPPSSSTSSLVPSLSSSSSSSRVEGSSMEEKGEEKGEENMGGKNGDVTGMEKVRVEVDHSRLTHSRSRERVHTQNVTQEMKEEEGEEEESISSERQNEFIANKRKEPREGKSRETDEDGKDDDDEEEEEEERKRIRYHRIQDGQVFTVQGARLRVIYTPGHTDDHIVLYFESKSSPSHANHHIDPGLVADVTSCTQIDHDGSGDAAGQEEPGDRHHRHQYDEPTDNHDQGSEGEEGVFTGDSILGHGTAVFEDLKKYMSSLELIRDIFRRRRRRLLHPQVSPPSSSSSSSSPSLSTPPGGNASQAEQQQRFHEEGQETGKEEEKEKQSSGGTHPTTQDEEIRENPRIKIRMYPGHGSVIEDGERKVDEYIAHRRMREEQVLRLLESVSTSSRRSSMLSSSLAVSATTMMGETSGRDGDGYRDRDGDGDEHGDQQQQQQQRDDTKHQDQRSQKAMTAREMVAIIYQDVRRDLWDAAERGILLILNKLKEEGKNSVIVDDDDDDDHYSSSNYAAGRSDGEDQDQDQVQIPVRTRETRWMIIT